MGPTLLDMVLELAGLGIATTIRKIDGVVIAEFVDGFYKSDGLAYLQMEDGDLVLNARYGEKTKILGPSDVIACSKNWYEYSKDRFYGWATPPQHWDDLYNRFGG